MNQIQAPPIVFQPSRHPAVLVGLSCHGHPERPLDGGVLRSLSKTTGRTYAALTRLLGRACLTCEPPEGVSDAQLEVAAAALVQGFGEGDALKYSGGGRAPLVWLPELVLIGGRVAEAFSHRPRPLWECGRAMGAVVHFAGPPTPESEPYWRSLVSRMEALQG